MVHIHVALLWDGTPVWRPVQARLVHGTVYEILGQMPDEEQWEYQPGQLVECRQHVFAGGSSGLIAYRPAAG